jgi:hypothetical protein
MQGEPLGTKYHLARGGSGWAWRDRLELWYQAAASDTLYPKDPELRRQFRELAWNDLAYLIRVGYEARDGSSFRAIANAVEQGPDSIDRIRHYVFHRIIIARDCDEGKLPTQAQLRAELVQLGCPNNDSLRMSVKRACEDSEQAIPKGKPGRKGNNS